MRATATTGKAVTRRKLVTSVIQLKRGMRIIFRPGARRLMMVVMKFTPPMMELIPRMERPMSQNST